jgi:hypothetical protein
VRKRRDERAVLRTVRGALLALSSAGLAITAHVLADGRVPDTALTLLLTVLVGWIGAALAEKTKGPVGVLAVLGIAQVAMHLVLGGLMADGLPSAGMVAAHGVATFSTGLVLTHAESMLLAAAAGLWLLLPVVWRSAPVPAAPAAVPVRTPSAVPLLSVLLRRVHGRRGPPAHS